VYVRTTGDASTRAEAIRADLQKLMPGDAMVKVRPLSELIEAQEKSWTMGATLFVAFGGLALLLASIGLYSVIAYNVAQRVHEIGVRVALGAQSGDVARLVLGQGLSLAVAGVALGAAVALWAGRFVKPMLFDQSPSDPVIFAGVAACLLGVAVIASLVPAMRATRVDPVTALRSD
jgi:ABC-type antimicrobial peptide transport system permease subunit